MKNAYKNAFRSIASFLKNECVFLWVSHQKTERNADGVWAEYRVVMASGCVMIDWLCYVAWGSSR